MPNSINKRDLRSRLSPLVAEALQTACEASAAEAWPLLERVHILSQPFALLHVKTHIHMLKRALRECRWRELFGQLPRLLFAGPASLIGRYPRGNRGTTVVSMFRHEPMAPELEELMSNRGDGSATE
jgi:hypothetical protein